jgi:hypothetical protein
MDDKIFTREGIAKSKTINPEVLMLILVILLHRNKYGARSNTTIAKA